MRLLACLLSIVLMHVCVCIHGGTSAPRDIREPPAVRCRSRRGPRRGAGYENFPNSQAALMLLLRVVLGHRIGHCTPQFSVASLRESGPWLHPRGTVLLQLAGTRRARSHRFVSDTRMRPSRSIWVALMCLRARDSFLMMLTRNISLRSLHGATDSRSPPAVSSASFWMW